MVKIEYPSSRKGLAKELNKVMGIVLPKKKINKKRKGRKK